jgi:hypothetical protein
MAKVSKTATFSHRHNAKRAAEKAIRDGTALSIDYGIKPLDNGRFDIVWKNAPTVDEVEAEIAMATAADYAHYSTNTGFPVNEDPSYAPPSAEAEKAAAVTGSEPAASNVPNLSVAPERDNKWPDGTRVMVRNKPKSWSEATIHTRLDVDYWRVQYPSGGTGMFKEGDIRAYDPEGDAKRPKQPRRARATGQRTASRSRYALDPAVIAAGKLPDKAPVVTSAANPHYQKRFDELHKLAVAGDWVAVRDYKVSGSNSYSKLVARYQQDLLALHAASETAQ